MEFASLLMKWFRENGRDLPWRQTRDPYAIWLSEIILQQTQVKQGWDYWERFMRRWPTVEALAAATEDDVLREWQGLGYYSRARNLHYAARQVVELGGFPQTLEGLRSLKGVGDYTAAAIGRPLSMVMSIVYLPVILVLIRPSTPLRVRRPSRLSPNPFCPRQNTLTYPLPRNTIKPSWTSVLSSVPHSRPIV